MAKRSKEEDAFLDDFGPLLDFIKKKKHREAASKIKLTLVNLSPKERRAVLKLIWFAMYFAWDKPREAADYIVEKIIPKSEKFNTRKRTKKK